MAHNLRISQDPCALKMKEMQNTEQADYQFFNVQQTSCNATIAPKNAVNLYTDARSVPVSLIDQESAMKGLGVRANACGIVCGGQEKVLEHKPTYHPEFCPIIATQVTPTHCSTE